MAKILNIVERAYQGTLEEQDDQAIWLAHALKNAGLDQAILLRGPATAYAVKGQTVGSFQVGGVKAGNPPRIDEDLKRLAAKGVEVFGVKDDAQARGILPEEAIPEVKWLSRGEVAGLFQRSERIFAW